MVARQHFGWRWPALLIVSALLLAGCDWPMFRYGPAHTGYNNTETTIGVGNVANLRPLFTTGHGSYFDGSVVVANGVLYGVDDVGLTAYDATGSDGLFGNSEDLCATVGWSRDEHRVRSDNAGGCERGRVSRRHERCRRREP